jgi:hypothetical protein
VRDQLTPGQPACQVALRAEHKRLVETLVADARFGRDEIPHRHLAVVEDEQLPRLVVLGEEAADRERHERAPVAGRHDAGDEGRVGQDPDPTPLPTGGTFDSACLAATRPFASSINSWSSFSLESRSSIFTRAASTLSYSF